MSIRDERRIATLDFETDPFKHGRYPQAFAVGFFDGTCYQSKWGTHLAVLNWAVGRCANFNGIVYAHNGGKFDFLAFLLAKSGTLAHGEPVMCIGGRIVKMRFGMAELRDSYAILPAPLSSHDKGEIDYRWFEKAVRNKHKRVILEYLNRDVVSLHQLVTAFIADHGLAPLTAASAGMKYAKKLGIQVETLNDKKDTYHRSWYFGGLVLARKPGIHRGNFTLYDIKSAYPYAMLHHHAGGRDFAFKIGRKGIKPQSFVALEGKADCFLSKTKDGNTYGGSGRFMVTGWEWLQAIANGSFVGKVLYNETPCETVDFKPYVNTFYDKKAECERTGDTAGRLINKIMLNSLYGKYAQRNDRFRDYFLMPLEEPIGDGFTLEAEFTDAGLCVWSKPAPGGQLYNVATAASITGFVRAMLMKAIYETDPYYCDTDSIIANSNRKPKGIHGNLGGWSVECRGDLLYIGGKKLYAMRIAERLSAEGAKKKGYHWDGSRAWKVASKGCRLTPLQIKQICQGKSIKYQNDAPCYSLLNSPFFVTRTIKRTSFAASVKPKQKQHKKTK